jgi:hypothetical protein
VDLSELGGCPKTLMLFSAFFASRLILPAYLRKEISYVADAPSFSVCTRVIMYDKGELVWNIKSVNIQP